MQAEMDRSALNGVLPPGLIQFLPACSPICATLV